MLLRYRARTSLKILDFEIVAGPRALIGSPVHFREGHEMNPFAALMLETCWMAYLIKPLKQRRISIASLFVLRALCHRGRAVPPPELARLFSSNCLPKPPLGPFKRLFMRDTREPTNLPDSVFKIILEYWIQPLIF